MRVLAWMIYLNDVTDGGYNEFPQKKKYEQEQEMVVAKLHILLTHIEELPLKQSYCAGGSLLIIMY